MGNLSIQSYFDDNAHIIHRPDIYIKRMIADSILPSNAYQGRMTFGNLSRTVCVVRPEYLIEYEDQIVNWMEDNIDETEKNAPSPRALYNALATGCMIAAFNGLVEFRSPQLKDLAPVIAKLGTSTQTLIFTRRETADKVFHTV
jgi:hypothetical protein